MARETFGVARVVARIYDAKRAAVYERLGIPTVATVRWTTDRLMRMLLPEGVASAWRDPTGTVAILPLPVHQDWVGRPVRELEAATGARVAYIIRFGTGVLPRAETVVQAETRSTSLRCRAPSATSRPLRPRRRRRRAEPCGSPSREPAPSAAPSPRSWSTTATR